MALALCAHPRPALRACEEERPRTDAPGTQRNETTALAPPSGLPDRRLPAKANGCVCASHGAFRYLVHTQETSLAFPGHVTWIYRRWHRGGSVQRALGPFGTPKTPGLLTHRRPGPAPWSGAALGVSSTVSYRAPRVTSSPNWPFERWWWTPLPMGPLLLLHGTARGLLRRPEGRARLLGSAQDTSVTRPLRPLHSRYVRYMAVEYRTRPRWRPACAAGGVRGRLWRGRDTTHARNAAAGVLYDPRFVRGGSA